MPLFWVENDFRDDFPTAWNSTVRQCYKCAGLAEGVSASFELLHCILLVPCNENKALIARPRTTSSPNSEHLLDLPQSITRLQVPMSSACSTSSLVVASNNLVGGGERALPASLNGVARRHSVVVRANATSPATSFPSANTPGSGRTRDVRVL